MKPLQLSIFSALILMALSVASCETEVSATAYSGMGNEYKMGETMIFVPDLPANVDSVEYYIEEDHVATCREMPFVLEYKLVDYIAGNYKLVYAISYNGQKQYKTTYITIIY